MEQPLSDDFKDFLKLCGREKLKFLLIGGYAVNYYGYHRTTADMDIWIELSRANAARMVKVIEAFGFVDPDLCVDLFLEKGTILRMGVAPLRLDILNQIDGVTFGRCYAARKNVIIDGVPVSPISLRNLKKNKLASGRPKDLDDYRQLPD